MITIYHNPKCSKSREGLRLLEDLGKPFKKVLYMENKLSEKELTEIVKKLNIPPIELVRKKEVLWRENYKDKNLSNEEIISLMAENQNLIERPIVVNENRAVVGRPISKIEEVL